MWSRIGKMTVIAKRESMYFGTFGISMFLAGLIFIDRKNGRKAAQVMNDVMEDLKKKDIKLCVFPEGTRRNTGEIHSFKKGAFHAAVQVQVPIVPVVFSSYKSFLNADKKILNNSDVIVTALPAISTSGMTADDVDELVQQTRKIMIETFNRTSKEIEIKIKNASC